jgi:putative FmdB family regulatory protein
MHTLIKEKEMPIYEYLCLECGARSEIARHFWESNEGVACPVCGKFALERQYSSIFTPSSTCGTTEQSSG